jgi:hypothetical protein
MKKLALVAAVAGLLLASGCAVTPSPVVGILFTDVKYPSYYDGASEMGPGSKTGMATAEGILALVATGDASVEAACKNGGISKIRTVDQHAWSILGIYTKFTTRVTGE